MNPGVKEPRLSLSNCGFLFRLLFLNVILCLQCLGRVGARRIACFFAKALSRNVYCQKEFEKLLQLCLGIRKAEDSVAVSVLVEPLVSA